MEINMYESGFNSENTFNPSITNKARKLSQGGSSNPDFNRP